MDARGPQASPLNRGWYAPFAERDKIQTIMTTTITNPPQEARYQPTPAQEARAAALRRFNLWVVYVPLGLITAAVLALVIAMVILAVIEPRWRPITSAVADLLIILAILPTLLLCAILPAAAGFLVYDSRSKGRAPLQALRTLLWRLDSLVSTIQGHVGRFVDRVAPPSARIRATFVRLETTARRLAQRTPGPRSKQHE